MLLFISKNKDIKFFIISVMNILLKLLLLNSICVKFIQLFILLLNNS